MRHLLKIFIAGFLITSPTFGASASHGPGEFCLPREEAVKTLEQEYGEVQTDVGVVNDGSRVLEVFRTLPGVVPPTWTIMWSYLNGRTCIFSAGADWTHISNPNPPTPKLKQEIQSQAEVATHQVYWSFPDLDFIMQVVNLIEENGYDDPISIAMYRSLATQHVIPLSVVAEAVVHTVSVPYYGGFTIFVFRGHSVLPGREVVFWFGSEGAEGLPREQAL